MLAYRPDLKYVARELRSRMTDAEQKLWFHLRRKQMAGVPFYRQRPIGNYIVDFFAPSAKLIVEVDGSQHHDDEELCHDMARTAFLTGQGFAVLRFNNLQVLQETVAVLDRIHSHLTVSDEPHTD